MRWVPDPRAQKAELIAQAQTLLAAEKHERRRRVVFIIDEAHLLAPDQLEELRLLTNAVIWTTGREACLLRRQQCTSILHDWNPAARRDRPGDRDPLHRCHRPKVVL